MDLAGSSLAPQKVGPTLGTLETGKSKGLALGRVSRKSSLRRDHLPRDLTNEGTAFQVEGPAATRRRGGRGLGVSEEETEGQGV